MSPDASIMYFGGISNFFGSGHGQDVKIVLSVGDTEYGKMIWRGIWCLDAKKADCLLIDIVRVKQRQNRIAGTTSRNCQVRKLI